jgi:outer membrane lipoprotein-sorting protein
MNTHHIPLMFAAALAPVFCATVDDPAIMQKVREKYRTAKTVRASFVQRTWWAVREKEETKSGTLLTGADDKFRVELGGVLWVCDGATVWQYSRASSQVIIRPLSAIDRSAHPSQLLLTYINTTGWRQTGDSAGVVTVEAAPDSLRRRGPVHLRIDTGTASILAVVTQDGNGNRNTYSFTSIRLNAPVPKGSFAFAVPKNANILDTRN